MYGGHKDMVMCMAVHRSMVRAIFCWVGFFLFSPVVGLSTKDLCCVSDLHGLLRRQRAGGEAEPAAELPLLGETEDGRRGGTEEGGGFVLVPSGPSCSGGNVQLCLSGEWSIRFLSRLPTPGELQHPSGQQLTEYKPWKLIGPTPRH